MGETLCPHPALSLQSQGEVKRAPRSFHRFARIRWRIHPGFTENACSNVALAIHKTIQFVRILWS